jgi:hypothetical protein
MWDDRFAAICAQHPDLVAVYESSRGRLGLLLRQTLVPLNAERVEWLAETRAVARGVIAELRAGGFTGGAIVLQWLPIRDVARIVARWVRRWDGDPARRSRLLAVVERRLVDERFLASRRRHATMVPAEEARRRPGRRRPACPRPTPGSIKPGWTHSRPGTRRWRRAGSPSNQTGAVASCCRLTCGSPTVPSPTRSTVQARRWPSWAATAL